MNVPRFKSRGKTTRTQKILKTQKAGFYLVDQPVPKIDVPLLAPTKLMNLNNKEGMKSEKSRRCFKTTQKAIPKIKVSSPEEGKREGKIGENKEIDRKRIQLRIDKQPLH